MKFLQSPEARMHGDFNEGATEGAHEFEEALRSLEEVWLTLFLSHLCRFKLSNHGPPLSSILVDLASFKITGVVNLECTGTR